MKTLNDYIKESILDDEDVLMNKAEDDSKNPFIVIGNLIASSNDLSKDTSTQRAIDKIIKNELVKYLPDIFKGPQHLFIQYFKDVVTIKPVDDGDLEFLKIRGGYQDHKAVVYFLESHYKSLVKLFRFKNDAQYEKWVKDFMKKFYLTPTPHDMFIGTI